MIKPMKFILSICFCLVFFAFCMLNVFAEPKVEGVIEEQPQKVSISFDSMGGTECNTIYGYAGETEITEDMLPIPTKEGYTFKGWRHFNEYGMPFELMVFPNYDITLVASFKPNGFAVTFEEGISEVYDINGGVELYAPDTKKYSKEKVKEGWRCLKTKKNSDVSPMFLLSYHNALEVGKEYELTINIKSDRIGAKGNVYFAYTQNPDVRDESIGYYKAFSIEKNKKGVWKEYKVKFIAAAPYIVVNLPDINGIYIDDIKVENTGVTGEAPKLQKEIEESVISAMTIAGFFVGLTAGIALFFILRKKK